LKPEFEVLDLPEDQSVSLLASAKIVMSRSIYNLLDATKDTLITDMYMKGELKMYGKDSDGSGFLKFMVLQTHANFRHELAQPSIIATLQPPRSRNEATLY